MTVTVASATSEHTDAIVVLLEEMDRFYGAAEFDPLDVRVRQVRQVLFADPPAAYALLAWNGEQLAGIASYSFLWPAVGLTRSLYLKELYVREAQRGVGVGSALMCALFDVAAEHECSRVEWTTDENNTAAQCFYEGLDLSLLPTKLFYRVDAAALEQRLR